MTLCQPREGKPLIMGRFQRTEGQTHAIHFLNLLQSVFLLPVPSFGLQGKKDCKTTTGRPMLSLQMCFVSTCSQRSEKLTDWRTTTIPLVVHINLRLFSLQLEDGQCSLTLQGSLARIQELNATYCFARLQPGTALEKRKKN